MSTKTQTPVSKVNNEIETIKTIIDRCHFMLNSQDPIFVSDREQIKENLDTAYSELQRLTICDFLSSELEYRKKNNKDFNPTTKFGKEHKKAEEHLIFFLESYKMILVVN